MADNVTFTLDADATPPGGTQAATEELADGSHAGLAKLLISDDTSRDKIPATVADGLLVEVSNPTAGTGLTDAELRASPVDVEVAAALPAGNNNIGDVDIASLPNEGQQTMANSISVAIASNQSAVPISGAVTTDGLTDAELRATPVPVSGTVTANAGTNLNTSLLALEAGGNLAAAAASLATLDNIVSGSEAQVDVVAPLPAGTNNIGDVDVLSSALPTGASTLAEQQTQTASLSVLDDWDESDRAKVNVIVGQAGVAAGTGTDSATTQRVSLATNVALPAGTNNIGDVDVLTLPAIPAGNNNIGDVDIASLPNEGQQTMANSISVAVASDQSGILVVGGAANASPVSGNPVLTAGRASNAVPTDVGADGDAASVWMNRNGAQVVTMAPHMGLIGSPWTLTSETAQYTSTQTSTVLVAGGASERLVITKVQIQVGGTTAGTLQLYFGTAAYSRGTNLAIFDGEFAPSATLKPGVIMDGPFISAANGDDLLVTDSAAINPLTITVWYYVLV